MADIQRGIPIEESVLVHYLQQAQTEADPSAFDGLYLLYADRVYRFLLARVGNVDAAEEITSEVFLRLIEKIDKYRISPKDNVSIFSAWLYRLAYNKMIDIIRKQKRTKHVAIENAFGLAAKGNLNEDVETKLEVEHVVQKLQHLNEQQRQVIVLRFLEGYSVAETAGIMQKSEGAIKALQHRSLNSLRRHLQN